MSSLWQKWKKLSHKVLDKQSNLILSLLYWLLLAPLAIVFKLLSDPLHRRSNPRSFWFSKDTQNTSNLSALKQQS